MLDQALALLGHFGSTGQAAKPTLNGPVGAHLRHVVEHYAALVFPAEAGVVNYDARPRERALESDPLLASSRLHVLRQGLATWPAALLETHRKVQSTIANFPSSLPTQRECQVLFYMISDYSSAPTAQRQSATEGTIKIHRKNTYRKLDIGSQAGLFSLFINYMLLPCPRRRWTRWSSSSARRDRCAARSLFDVAPLRS